MESEGIKQAIQEFMAVLDNPPPVMPEAPPEEAPPLPAAPLEAVPSCIPLSIAELLTSFIEELKCKEAV